jgi:hypothetical protein
MSAGDASAFARARYKGEAKVSDAVLLATAPRGDRTHRTAVEGRFRRPRKDDLLSVASHRRGRDAPLGRLADLSTSSGDCTSWTGTTGENFNHPLIIITTFLDPEHCDFRDHPAVDTDLPRPENGACGSQAGAMRQATARSQEALPRDNDRTSPPRLAALTTAWPPHILRQEDVAANGAEMFATTHGGFERLAPIYRNALIDTRHSCVPMDWYLQPHSFAERNDLFLEHAVALMAESTTSALEQAG